MENKLKDKREEDSWVREWQVWGRGYRTMTSVGITEIGSWERGPEFTFILGAAEKTLAGVRCVYVWCQQGPGRESDSSEL